MKRLQALLNGHESFFCYKPFDWRVGLASLGEACCGQGSIASNALLFKMNAMLVVAVSMSVS